MNLFVGNLSPETSEEQLRQLFSEFGEIKSTKIPIDNATGLPRGFGFVEMDDKFHGYDAIDNLDCTYFMGAIISVKESKPKTQGGSGNRGGGFNRNRNFNRQDGGGGGGFNRNRSFNSNRSNDRGGNDRNGGDRGNYNSRSSNYNNGNSYNNGNNYNSNSGGYNNDKDKDYNKL